MNGRLDERAVGHGRAMAMASSRFMQPSTSIVIRCVAPSPSPGIIWASVSQTSLRACLNMPRSEPCSDLALAWPLARTSTVSFVLACPSTEMQLNETSTASVSSS